MGPHRGGSSSASLPTSLPSTRDPLSRRKKVGKLLAEEIDPSQATASLLFVCFLAGFTSVIPFTACYIWCGFQSGGVAQLGLAVARNFAPVPQRTYSFEKQDQQALCSLITFILGASLGRIGDRMGPKTRKWLVSASFVQSLFLAAAAVLIYSSGESSYAASRTGPSWTSPKAFAALGFASASLGLQGIIAHRLNTNFTTGIVLTTVWVEIINDPLLCAPRRVATRDHKLGAALLLFFGAVVGRAVLDLVGAQGALAVGVGLRIVLAASWIWVPREE